jgi:general secretion pathway protein G
MKKIATLQALLKKLFSTKKPKQDKKRHEEGFTIVEILVALIIISILMGAVGFTYFANVGKAKIVAAKSQIKSFDTALTNFFLDCNQFPDTAQGLGALLAAPSGLTNWKGPYLSGSVPVDPWGNAYTYQAPASNGVQPYEIRSLGRDGTTGGAGEDEDLISWDL